jgi:hypothetical protein
MEVDDIIGEPIWAEWRMIERRTITKELDSQEREVFEDESITLYHTTYDKNTKKLLFKKVNLRNKNVL